MAQADGYRVVVKKTYHNRVSAGRFANTYPPKDYIRQISKVGGSTWEVLILDKNKPNPSRYAKYSVQSDTWFGNFRTERNFTGLASAKKDARDLAKTGVGTRVMDKDSGKVYISYKGKKTN